MKLKKGSIEAKRFMAKIRAKKKTAKKVTKKPTVKKRVIKKRLTKKSIGSVKKGYIPGGKVKRIGSTHKDTASHNVKISVMSGVNELRQLENLEKELKNFKFALNYSQDYLKNNSDKFEKERARKAIRFTKDKIKDLNLSIRSQKRLLKKHL
jgi:hypothetical protein